MSTFGLRGRKGIYMPASFGTAYSAQAARGRGDFGVRENAYRFVDDFLGFKTAKRLQTHASESASNPIAFNARWLVRLEALKNATAEAYQNKMVELNDDTRNLSSQETQEMALRFAENYRDQGLMEIETEFGAGAISSLNGNLSRVGAVPVGAGIASREEQIALANAA